MTRQTYHTDTVNASGPQTMESAHTPAAITAEEVKQEVAIEQSIEEK